MFQNTLHPTNNNTDVISDTHQCPIYRKQVGFHLPIQKENLNIDG